MNKLTRYRELKGWSRSELARRARLHASDVGKFENGRAVPYESQLKKLARALGIPADEAPALTDEIGGGDE